MPTSRRRGAPDRDDRRAWILILVPLAGIAWRLAGTPAPILLAALVPAAGHAALLLWIARAAGVRLRSGVALFAVAWGAAVAAPAAAWANELLQARFGSGGWPLGVAGAPALEEAAKAGVLIVLVAVWPTEVRGARAGIVSGGLVGLGFAVAENVAYFLLATVQEGSAGLLRAVAVRGVVEGAVHPVFAASAGAGLGLGRAAAGGRGWVRPALLGFAAATAQHAVWNGVASSAVAGILCNGVGPSGACRGGPDLLHLVAVPLVVATALAPGVVALAALARRDATGRAGA